MNTHPLVSLCVVCYNHAKYVTFCLESLWKQSYKDIEILILDDGSTDNSAEMIRTLQAKSPCPIQFFAQSNSGKIGKNFNTLFRQAKGKYISLIAADDALLPDAISKKVSIMEQDANVQFVINSHIQRIDEYHTPMGPVWKMNLDKIKHPTAQDTLNLEFNEMHSYYLQGSLFRKSVLQAVNYFDEDMTADDIILRTKLARFLLQNPLFTFHTLHEVACLYRAHATNTSANLTRQLFSIGAYLDKYWPSAHVSRNFRDLVLNTFANEKDRIALYEQVSPIQSVRQVLSSISRQDILGPQGVCYKRKKIAGVLEIVTYKNMGTQTKLIRLWGRTLYQKISSYC